MKANHYRKFALMLALSFVIMYAVMYLNVYQADHIYLSMTRFYMTLLMICPMALVMLIAMRSMYKNKTVNTIIVVCSIAVFGLALAGVRTQTLVGDVQYMKGMIPHHSIAIMTSTRADIKDPEVKKLSQGIIEAQEREIAEMKRILARMDK
ncbi:DUF305 domain-containing protein [Pedobacter endophyticus]|uniref:DUF305 domain-containing protein n=1 Tax=Pedobacter endophyticus TaxID=2789740 RepID=A0A7S9PZX6_9SPHI|nr:DUF305 domain-containing protein [Pedobacter endophyticus]QPH40117.1 DUF305 domain-containing protein [Pedobacter endophyticus]